MVGAVELLIDGHRLAIVFFGVLVVPALHLGGSQIDQVFGHFGVPVPEEPAVHGEHTIEQGLAGIVVAGVKMVAGKFAESVGELGRVCAGCLAKLEGLFHEGDRLGILAAYFEHLAICRLGLEHGWIGRRQVMADDVQPIAGQLLGLVQPGLVGAEQSESDLAFRHVHAADIRSLLAQQCAPLRQRLL